MNGQRIDVLGIRNNQNEMILGIGEIAGDFVVLSTVFERQGYAKAIAFDGKILNDSNIILEMVNDFEEVKIPCSQIRAIYTYKDIQVS